jgi:hypothetical protein
MTRQVRWAATVVVLLGSTFIAGCASTIDHVLADPARYRDRDVKLSGAVTDSFSLTERGVYRLDDHTGQLWIVSDRGVPRVGAKVTVHGTVREGYNIGSLGGRLPAGAGSGLVLMETSHKAK